MSPPSIYPNMSHSESPMGKAYLVGAGPGDPELLTLKAQRILQTVDVVLYDYLVDSRILRWCHPDAERVYVGKSGLTGHHLSQEEIETLIVDYCRAGQTVCRLKGGDPYLFGRGAEEGERLVEAGIPFEVVPGITSALAVPLYAGIPVTHREHASAVSIITGHEDPTKLDSMLDWPILARQSGTLVFLMGVKQLDQIVSRLIENGKPAETSVALIRWGTRPQQETVTGTLINIVSEVEKHGLLPPCIIVIGQVVSCRSNLNWFESLPLFGKTIVITRARSQASEIRQQLEQRGANVIEFPTIAIEPVMDTETIRYSLAELRTFNWVIFTSPNGVEHTFNHLQAMGKDARYFSGLHIAAIGPATAQALQNYGLFADLIPETFVAEAIFEALTTQLGSVTGKRFYLPRADIARDDLVIALEEAGAFVKQVPIYHTVVDTVGGDIDELITAFQSHSVDMVTFSSASTVTNFVKRLQLHLEADPHLLQGVQLASIGPITSQTIRTLLGRVDIEAQTYTIPGLMTAIEAHFTNPTQSLAGVR